MDSLTYGQAPKVPEENVDKMVAELNARKAKRSEYSRRRCALASLHISQVVQRCVMK